MVTPMDVLLTPRLRLRWFRLDDAEFILGLINEPAWIAGIRDSGVRDVDAARAWAQARLIDPYWQVGHGFWLVERRSDAEPLGLCGLFKRDSLPLPDLGYGLATRHAGQGYAREAARACLAYAQRVLGRDELLAITSPTNGPSMALLEDLGFVREGERVGEDGPTVDWRWRATHRDRRMTPRWRPTWCGAFGPAKRPMPTGCARWRPCRLCARPRRSCKAPMERC